MKVFTNEEEIEKEIRKCTENPYYFATNYITVKNNLGETKPFTTNLSEKMFNEFIKNTK
jgi:hypothetical protein